MAKVAASTCLVAAVAAVACGGRTTAGPPGASVPCNLRCVWQLDPVAQAVLDPVEVVGTRELLGQRSGQYYRIGADGALADIPLPAEDYALPSLHPLGTAIGLLRPDPYRFEIYALDGSLRVTVPLSPPPENQRDTVLMVADDARLLVHRRIMDLEYFVPVALYVVDYTGAVLASYTAPDQMGGTVRVGRDGIGYLLRSEGNGVSRRRIADGGVWWNLDHVLDLSVADDGDTLVTSSYLDEAQAIGHYVAGERVGDLVRPERAIWNLAITGSGRFSAVSAEFFLYGFERGELRRAWTADCRYVPWLTVSENGDVVHSCQDEAGTSRVSVVAPTGELLAEVETGDDDGGWSPWPEFVFDDRTFFVRHRVGVALLQVTGRDPGRSRCPALEALCGSP